MVTQSNSSGAQAHWRLGRWLWERCSASEVRLISIALVAVAVVLGYAFPQAPTLLRSDPASYRDWSSAVQAQFRGWTPLLTTIGVFWVQDTVWFRILCFSLIFVLLVSIGGQVADGLGSVPIRQSAAFYGHAGVTVIDSARPASEVLETVQEAIRGFLDDVREHVQGDGTYLLGSRGRHAHGAKVVLYGGLLCAVAALLINGSWGWQQQGVQLLPGELIGLGPRGRHQVELVDTGTVWDEAQLRTAQGEAIQVKPGKATWHGLYRYRAVDGGGPLVVVEAQQNGGRLMLYDYAVRPEPVETLYLLFPAARSASQEDVDRLFIVSEANVVGRLKWLRDSASPPRTRDLTFYLWVFAQDGQTVLGEQQVVGGQTGVTASVGNVVFQFRFSRSFVVEISYWPGLWLLGLGALLTLAGSLAVLMPRQRVWVVVSAHTNGATVRLREQTEGLSYRYRRQTRETLDRMRLRLEDGGEA